MFYRFSRMFFHCKDSLCLFGSVKVYREIRRKIWGLCEALHGSARIRSYRRTLETGVHRTLVTDIFCVLPVNID
jgi:hypothetical protein